YFQTYRNNGYPMERSESMGEHRFTLDEDRKQAALLKEYYDDVELQSGVKVRRVTLKISIPEWSVMSVSWTWKGTPPPVTAPIWWQPRPKGPRTPKGSPPRAPGFVSKTPYVFIQYASDVGPTEARILDFQDKRDKQIAELESTIDQDLGQLRSRMIWISLITLGALWLGGYLVIRLGLAPLSKMSEAV